MCSRLRYSTSLARAPAHASCSWHFQMNQFHFRMNATAVSISNDMMNLYFLQCMNVLVCIIQALKNIYSLLKLRFLSILLFIFLFLYFLYISLNILLLYISFSTPLSALISLFLRFYGSLSLPLTLNFSIKFS